MSITKQTVGLLGGTFNPVHIGHMILAQDALEKFELDEVIFIPSATPPHKNRNVLANAEHRLAMLQLAIEGDLNFSVSTLEYKREGPSFTVDTVNALRTDNPETAYKFIIGADTLPELHTWKDIYELLTLCEFITLQRPGFLATDLPHADLCLEDFWTKRLFEQVANGHGIDISSTEIRMRVAEGMSIRYLVPNAVEMYIYEHNLYKF